MLKICLAEYIGENIHWDKDYVYQAKEKSEDLNLLLAAYEHWTAGTSIVLAEDSRSILGQACTLCVRVISTLLLQHTHCMTRLHRTSQFQMRHAHHECNLVHYIPIE